MQSTMPSAEAVKRSGPRARSLLRWPRLRQTGLVLVANAAIGIIQEVRAKRALDRLRVLTAPKARAVRAGIIVYAVVVVGAATASVLGAASP